MKPKADTGQCMGSGMCVGISPEYFDQDPETGLVVIMRERVSAEDADEVGRAVEACPTGALSLIDDE